MIWKPNVTVAAVVERDGRFLMVEEEEDGGIVYNQPAGHLDEGEGLREAAVRETLEETAWHFQPHAIIGVYQWTNTTSATTYLRVCFAGSVDGHEPQRRLDAGIRQALWMTHTELSALAARLRSPMVLRCIEDYLAGKRYPLNLLTEMGAG